MKQERYICPGCRARAGVIIEGGPPDGPEGVCTACGHRWRIRRKQPGERERKQPVPDYFLLRLYLEAGIEAPYVEWRDGQLSKGRELYERVACPDPDEAAWRALWQRLGDPSVDVWGWQSHYDNRYVLDGLSWELEIRLGDVVKCCSGSNAYPDWAEPVWAWSARLVARLEAASHLARDRLRGAA